MERVKADSNCKLLIIGAGLGRTGTLSTRSALKQLLGHPCYHGAVPFSERPDHVAPWVEIFSSGRLRPEIAKELLTGYSAGLDLTIFTWYKELMEIYPDAKVLLTVRDPERWFASYSYFHNIVFRTLIQQPYSGVMTAMGLGYFIKFSREVLLSPTMPGILGRVNRAMLAGKEEAVEVFNSHLAEVKAHVPADRLLVFDVKDGWEPLCNFLDMPIPDKPFPNVNDTAMMRFSFKTICIVCWLVVIFVPLALAVFVPRCETFVGGLLVAALVLGIVPAAGQFLLMVVQKHVKKKQ